MKRTKQTKQIRIKITSHMCDNVSFITVTNGTVSYFTSGEIPLALSNLAGNNAAELRFSLQDSKDGNEAIAHVRRLCTAKKIELL